MFLPSLQLIRSRAGEGTDALLARKCPLMIRKECWENVALLRAYALQSQKGRLRLYVYGLHAHSCIEGSMWSVRCPHRLAEGV